LGLVFIAQLIPPGLRHKKRLLSQVFGVGLRSRQPIGVAVQQRIIPLDQLSQFASAMIHEAHAGGRKTAAARPRQPSTSLQKTTIREGPLLFPKNTELSRVSLPVV